MRKLDTQKLLKSDAGFSTSKYAGAGRGYCVARAITNYNKYYITNNNIEFGNIEFVLDNLINYCNSLLKITGKVEQINHNYNNFFNTNYSISEKHIQRDINKKCCSGVYDTIAYNWLIEHNYKVVRIHKTISLSELYDYIHKTYGVFSFIVSIAHPAHFSCVSMGEVIDTFNPFTRGQWERTKEGTSYEWVRYESKKKVEYIAFLQD